MAVYRDDGYFAAHDYDRIAAAVLAASLTEPPRILRAFATAVLRVHPGAARVVSITLRRATPARAGLSPRRPVHDDRGFGRQAHESAEHPVLRCCGR